MCWWWQRNFSSRETVFSLALAGPRPLVFCAGFAVVKVVLRQVSFEYFDFLLNHSVTDLYIHLSLPLKRAMGPTSQHDISG
jgi:hypothetical protein